MKQRACLESELKLERRRLGAKLRATRAILNLSQTEIASKVGLTQRSIHRLEQAQVDPKRLTSRSLERFWKASGINIVDMPDGTFSICVTDAVLCCDEDEHSIAPDQDSSLAHSDKVLG